MIVVDDPDKFELTGPVLSIGNFDGVHWGHRQLLGRMRHLAARDARPSVVITFFPPSKVVFGGGAFLSSAQEKIELLKRFEPSGVAIIPFSKEYSQTDKQVFLDQLARLHPATIIVGEDFRFGHKRQGTLNDLSRVTGKLEVFGLESLDGEVVKSSTLRELLAAGEVERAARLLGDYYLVMGEVVHGDGRGKQVGFPTANLEVDPQKALPLGVFAVTVERDGKSLPGMANSGPRPSFPERAPALEVHIFDFDGDLYGESLQVRFHSKIRGQMKFESLHDLREQLQRDAAEAKERLAADD